LAFVRTDKTLILVQKVLLQGTTSSKVVCLLCAPTLHGTVPIQYIYTIANDATSRHQDHFTVYEDHCKKLDIPMHPRATRDNSSSGLNR
jgi:hypothetical protein